MKPFIATLIALTLTAQLFAQPRPVPPPQPQQPASSIPTIVVTGRGEVFASPDRAVVRLGATAQDEKAAAAQQRVNELLQQILEKIQAAGVPENHIQTVGLTLTPIREQQERPGHLEQRIIGYQAANTIQVRLDDLARIGPIIDAALAAGANHLEGVSFELKDDAEQRRLALREAVADAREKARAIADASGHRLGQVVEITEGGLDIIRPMMMQRAMAMGAEATPVQPGQIRVEATVSIRYTLGQ